MPLFKVQPTVGRGGRSVVLGGEGTGSRALLGRLAELGPQREVWLDLDREHVVAIVGKRGSGKTHTLGVVVEGLSEARTGDVGKIDPLREHAVVVFDTLNLFQWVDIPLDEAKGANAERQRQSAARWKLTPRALKPTFWHPVGSDPATATSQSFSINPADMDAQDWGRLLNLDTAADPMGQLIADVYVKVRRISKRKKDHGARDYGVEDMLDVLKTDSDIQSDYAVETIRGVRQRLSALANSRLFDSTQPDWTTALRPGRVAIFLLGRVPEDLRSVLVFLVIRRLLEARSATSEAQKHALLTGAGPIVGGVPPTWLVVDEAQNILPARNATGANDILTRFVREGRNFGLSLALTTQQPSSIDPRVMAQVDTLIAHALTVRGDLNYVLANLKSADPSEIQIGARNLGLDDAVRMLDPGQCIISAVESPRLVFCEIRPRLTLHGGFEA
jgi:uncharacterized protein